MTKCPHAIFISRVCAGINTKCVPISFCWVTRVIKSLILVCEICWLYCECSTAIRGPTDYLALVFVKNGYSIWSPLQFENQKWKKSFLYSIGRCLGWQGQQPVNIGRSWVCVATWWWFMVPGCDVWVAKFWCWTKPKLMQYQNKNNFIINN